MSQPPPGSKDATSEKEHLLAVYKQTKKLPPKLANQPKLPEIFAHVWQWFLELNGNHALTYQEIESWARLGKVNITTNEANILRRLDSLFWKTINGRNRHTDNSGTERPSRRGEKTPV